MPETKESQSPERKNDFESRIERAESIAELLKLADEIIASESYCDKGEGAENLALINRKGIRRFGRRPYYDAFEERYGMAQMYMWPPETDE